MEKLVSALPDESPILERLAEKFKNVGLCEASVEAYIKFGDVKKAVDTCVVLNQWNKAVELAEKHNFLQIEQLL
jgi:WD repeat-containing protein 35